MVHVEVGNPKDVQPRARALGDPSRYRIFRYVFESDQPVSVADLTRYMHLNHNAIRQHLAVLCAVGLVAEEVEDRKRPGRPRLLYRTAPEVAGTWGTPGPVETLAGLLVQVIAENSDPRDVGKAAGLERVTKQPRSAALAQRPIDQLKDQLGELGFRPHLSQRADGTDVVLARCPYAGIVADSHRPICDLHLGIAEGMAEGIGGLKVISLTARDPASAGCCLRITETTAATSGEGGRDGAQARAHRSVPPATLRYQDEEQTQDAKGHPGV